MWAAQDVDAGQWIRAVGSDIAAGAVVLAAGERLGAAEIGILATVGAATVQVNSDSSLPARSPPGLMRAFSLVDYLGSSEPFGWLHYRPVPCDS